MDQLFGNMFKTLSDQTTAMQQSFNQMNIQQGYDWEYEEQDEVTTNASSGSGIAPKFDPFDKRKEKWENYLQRFNQHLTIYDITSDDKKRACLLSWVGPETYALLRNLFGQIDVQTQTFDALSENLTQHFKVSYNTDPARGLPFMGMGFGGGFPINRMTSGAGHQSITMTFDRGFAQNDVSYSSGRLLQHDDMMLSGRGLLRKDMMSSHPPGRALHHNNMMAVEREPHSSAISSRRSQYQDEATSGKGVKYDEVESEDDQSQMRTYSFLETAEDLSEKLESILEPYRLKGKDKLRNEIKCMTQTWYDGLGPQERSIATIANPLKYAWELQETYFKWEPITLEVLFVCMNPTRDSQTGIPFYDEKEMKQIFKNVNITKMRRGVDSIYLMKWNTDSGKPFWKFMKAKFGSEEAFFERCFVVHYCPLLFLDKANGHVFLDGFKKLRNPLLSRIMEQCDIALTKMIKTVKPKFVVGFGEFAFDRVEEATRKVERETGIKIAKAQIAHPSSMSSSTHSQWSKKADGILEKSAIWNSVTSKR